MKLVSIVVVTYNSRETVLETLDSIYAQTYSSIELIVSDDCSKDDTLPVVEGWLKDHEARFENVQVLRSPVNTGVTKNCNRGLSACRGEYMQLIAGDDLLMSNAIEEKIQFAEAKRLPFFACMVEPFGVDAEMVQRMKKWIEEGYNTVKSGYKTQVDEILRHNFYPAPGISFYQADWLKSIGGFDESYHMMEDYPFLFHYLMAGNEIVLLEKVLMRYRISDQSVCHSLNSESNKQMWHNEKRFFYRERLPEIIRHRKYMFAIRKTGYYTRESIKRYFEAKGKL